MDEFIIDFTYEQMPFTGLVSSPEQTGDELIYTCEVESQNQELNMDITPIPAVMAKWNGALGASQVKQEIMIRRCCRK
jgi:hypothetical protein